MIKIDKNRLLKIVSAVSERDRHIPALNKTLRGRERRAGEGAEHYGAFSELTAREVRTNINHAAWMGHLRIHRRGRHGYVSVTPKGIELVRDNLPEKTHKFLEASDSFSRLKARIGHPAERETLKESVRPWYGQVSGRVKSEEAYHKSLTNFLSLTMTVLDEKVSGAELARLFSRKLEISEVDVHDARNFVNYLFSDPIDRLADSRKFKER